LLAFPILLTFDVFHSGELMKPAELLEGASKGGIDYGAAWPPYYMGLEPSMNVFGGIPYSLPTWLETHHILRTLGLEEVAKEVCAKHRVYLLRVYPVSSWGALQSKVPILRFIIFIKQSIATHMLYLPACNISCRVLTANMSNNL